MSTARGSMPDVRPPSAAMQCGRFVATIPATVAAQAAASGPSALLPSVGNTRPLAGNTSGGIDCAGGGAAVRGGLRRMRHLLGEQMLRWLLAAVCCGMCTDLRGSEPAAEGQAFALHDGQRIVFFGDSITQQGLYVTYAHAYLLTRFPAWDIEIINHGISSETLSGTSEPDHDPPRPHALVRFTRDVAAWQPDVVVACFGMNDGNYHPLDEERFARFRQGVRRLWALVQTETHARLVLLTPPPFDPYRRTASDPRARTFGYKFPAVDYDQVLAAYSRWLVGLADEPDAPLIVDVHSAIHHVLAERRKGEVSFTVSPDAVHPNATGHWLMAQELLLAWRAPAQAGEVAIDAAAGRVTCGDATLVACHPARVEFTWRAPLPLPHDADWDEQTLEIAQTQRLLNRYLLRITGLAEGRYRLSAASRLVGVFDHQQLHAGLELGRHQEFPTVAVAQDVLARLRDLHTRRYAAWRQSLEEGSNGQQATAQPEELAAIRELCRPQPLALRLERVEE